MLRNWCITFWFLVKMDLLCYAPLGFVFYFSARINKMSVGLLKLHFGLFASIMGIISLASVFIEFTQTSIARVFFITAYYWCNEFVWIHNKKRSTKLGGFLFMGLIGINNCKCRKYFCWFICNTICYFSYWCIGICWFTYMIHKILKICIMEVIVINWF